MKISQHNLNFWSILLVSFLLVNMLWAQDESSDNEDDKSTEERAEDDKEDRFPWRERLFMGGNFQASFGNITLIDISPMLGVRISERADAGVGITYQYYRQRAGTYTTLVRGIPYSYTVENFQTSIYGARVFGRYFPVPTMFGQAEVEALSYSYEDVTDFGYQRRRAWVPGVFIGGGYSQPMGRRGALNMTVLYNVAYDEVRSPYNSPWVVRMGFTL